MTFSESDSASAKAVFDKINWSYEGNDILAYRHDCSAQSIKCGAALSVNSGKVAVLTYDSETFDVFLPGEYILNSTTLKKAVDVFGHELTEDELFSCDICFVDIMPRENLNWESNDGIWALDENGQQVSLSGKGSYGFRMSNPEVFLRKVFGREKSLTVEKFTAQLENLIIAGISGILTEYKIDIKMLCEERKTVVGFIGARLREKLNEYGFVLIGFTIDDFAVLNNSDNETANNDVIAPADDTIEQIQPTDIQDEPVTEQTDIGSDAETDNAEQGNSDVSSSDNDEFSFSFKESDNTIEEFELSEQEDTDDKFDFKLEIPDFDFDFLNLDEFMSDASMESSEDAALPAGASVDGDISEFSTDSIPSADEAIIQNGGSIKLDPQSISLLSDSIADAEPQNSDVNSDFAAELDNIISRTSKETKQENSYSIFANCPKCGKSVLKGMVCPECGTQVL